MELKSTLKVKGSKAEALLLHQQMGANNLCHLFRQKMPKKAGRCGAAQGKDRQSLSLPTGADTKPAVSCRFEKGAKGEKLVPSNDLGLCLSHQPHRTGDRGRVVELSHAHPLATSNRCPWPRYRFLQHDQQRPNRCSAGQRFPLAAGEHKRDSLPIELYQVFQQVASPKTPLSLFQLQSWWRGTMVRKNLGPYQGLKKKMEKKKSDHKEKEKKEEAGAKKKK